MKLDDMIIISVDDHIPLENGERRKVTPADVAKLFTANSGICDEGEAA